MKRTFEIFAPWRNSFLSAILVCVALTSSAIPSSKSVQCGMSDEAALTSSKCRKSTIQKIDELVIGPFITVVKFEPAKFDDDQYYKSGYLAQRRAVEFFIAHDVEVYDASGIFVRDNQPAPSNVIKKLLDAFRDFNAAKAGCMFSREGIHDGSISRSILVSYAVGDGTHDFVVVHFHFNNVSKIHRPRKSQRKSKVTSIEIFLFSEFGVVSPMLLKQHVLPNPSLQCETLLDQMDQNALSDLRNADG